MFFNEQSERQRSDYTDFLKISGALSRLYSDSNVPFLYYRIAEKVFCRSFEAEDLSRSDVSVDARKNSLGIGLKTFLAGNRRSFQKVAEFNQSRSEYESLEPESLVRKVSELRNARINFTENLHGLEELLYHCVVRDRGRFFIFEEPLEKIDIESIADVEVKRGSIVFRDQKNEYSFLVSKSTLTKRFITEPIEHDFDIEILQDPLLELSQLFNEGQLSFEDGSRIKGTIYLPLYSMRDGSVPEKSGLNQWNASGRRRDPGEVYIPVPAEIHRNYELFFPDRDTPFSLKLPDNREISAKISQDGGKALMSQSNKELGQWILRDVLGLQEGELFTGEKMKLIGIDSVRIDKIDDTHFEINFSELGSYERFRESFQR